MAKCLAARLTAQEDRSEEMWFIIRCLEMEELIQTPLFWVYLSRGGLPSVELVVVWGVWRVKPRLQEDTAQGDGLDGRRSLIGEAETYKHLEGKTS